LSGFPAKFFDRIVVVVLNTGLLKDIWAKDGDERRNWRVAGTGYKPASKNAAKLPIAPERRAVNDGTTV
jgi:hypothetical protein